MRLIVIHCILLACAASTLAEERPRRHLHQIKEMIVNKLFSSSEPICTQSIEPPAPPPPLETKFFRIPGFNNVVIKAVPKSSNPEPAPVYETLPPDSHIGIVGSYLGTKTLNETYNALLGVKNLLTSGVLSAKRDALQEVSLGQPPKIEIVRKPIQPWLAFPPLEPVRVLVNPPRVPVVPTQYMYKQVNQDGSVTTHTSSLDLDNGVRVTEDGKTLPFIIDRVRKIPVHLPVPALPEVSKIIVSKVSHPASTYMYQQVNQDGRLTSYMGLPSLMNQPGPVVVAETTKRIPPPPVFLMDRIEKAAAIASFPKAPIVDVVAKPVLVHAADAHVVNAPVAPGPLGYSYSQMSMSGMTTHSASGVNTPVFVKENGLPNIAIRELPSFPTQNPFRLPTSHGYSYSQIHTGGKMTNFNGVGAQAGPVNVIEHKPLLPVSPAKPVPPGLFSYKQVGDGKITTYTGQGILEENFGPTVLVHGVNHPVPPPHIADRIEKVAAGAKFNRPPYSTPFASRPISIPVPTNFVHVPAVQTSVPQRPVKIPSTSGTSPFLYRHMHKDGSVTTYGGYGLVAEELQLPPPADLAMPFPQGNVRVFESPMYSGPFPMNPVNPNTIKPSTPVSGSFSYKMDNTDMRGSHPPVGPIDGPIDGPIVDTFSAPPALPNMSSAAPIEGCIDPDIKNPIIRDIGATLVDSDRFLVEKPIPLTYSYKQISHNNPNPFLVVNVEDPIRGVNNVNYLNQNNEAYPLVPPPPLNPFPTVDVMEHKPATFIQPIPNEHAPNVNMPQPNSSPTSSFSYKQVSSSSYPSMTPPQPAFPVTEHKPAAFGRPPFAPPPMSDMYLSPVPAEMSPPSSFSYKQVISQPVQPIPSQIADVFEHRPMVPANPPPMINTRVEETEKNKIPPSSFSYKQVTNEGLYEYSDQFPTGAKTNLHSSAPKHQEIPSGNYVEPLPSLTMPASVPTSPMPIPAAAAPVPVRPMSTPSSPKPNGQNSLANNPIVVQEKSSFSFKSSNPDGSTITVKDDGQNSIDVKVEEATKTEETSSTVPVSPAIEPSRIEPVIAEEQMAASVQVGTSRPVSGHAKPMRRRVLKRKRPVSHRGDIPDAEA